MLVTCFLSGDTTEEIETQSVTFVKTKVFIAPDNLQSSDKNEFNRNQCVL